jgi:hypothetical protein
MLNDIFEKKKKSIIVPCTAAFSGGAVPHWPLMQRRHWCLPEVGVSHSCASHKQVSSHNLQVSSKSQVTVVRIKQVTSQVIAQVKQVTSQVIQKSDDLTQFPHLKIGKESGS